MNELVKLNATMSERQPQHPILSPPQSQASPNSIDFRVMELEIENSRLQRLVAELLLKNQQLRKNQELGDV